MSIKISKHVKFVIDSAAVTMNALGSETQTNDDILWDWAQKLHPEAAARSEEVLGKKVKPKRGHSGKKDN